MKRFLTLLLALLMLLPLGASAASPFIINKVTDPENDFAFPEDAKLLEIYIPKIFDAAAAFIRYGDYTMLFDSAGEHWQRTAEMLDMLGVTEMTYAFNSHPHTDHIVGFDEILKTIPAREFLLCFDEDYAQSNKSAFRVYDALHAMEVPFRRLYDGDTIEFGDVSMRILQRTDNGLTGNNRSAMLMVELGQRRFLFASDVQMDAQRLYAKDGADIQTDILQHPHHGYNQMQRAFLAATEPELVVITSLPGYAKSLDMLQPKKISYLHTHRGILKMTTDGQVWLVERIITK